VLVGLIRLLVIAVLALMAIRLLQQTGFLKPPSPGERGPEPGEYEDLSRKE